MKYYLLIVLLIIDDKTLVFGNKTPNMKYPIAVPSYDLPDLYGCYHECAPGKKIDRDARIIGGENARNGQIFYQAAIIDNNVNIFAPFCGAVIYNKSIAITAAHCTPFITPGVTVVRYNNLKVCLNFPNLPKTFDANIKKVIPHPGYNDTNGDNDIALVILDDETPFIFDVAPNFPDSIELYPENREPEDETLLTVSGWGLKNDASFQPACLQYIKVPVVNRELCKEIFGSDDGSSLNYVNDRMICAGGAPEGNKDICGGDSGGPLVLYKKGNVQLVGIVSRGTCGYPGYPAIYTLVTKFYNFILYYSG